MTHLLRGEQRLLAEQVVDEGAKLLLAETLPEVRRHHSRRKAFGNEGMGIEDRLLDVGSSIQARHARGSRRPDPIHRGAHSPSGSGVGEGVAGAASILSEKLAPRLAGAARPPPPLPPPATRRQI